MDDYNFTEYNLLNIDVQGYELEVLKGAANTLKYIENLKENEDMRRTRIAACWDSDCSFEATYDWMAVLK